MSKDNAFGHRNHKIVVVGLLGDVLRALASEKPGSVGRLNIITHAGSGSIPLSGEVRDDGDVFFGAPAGDPPGDVSVIDGMTLENLRLANSVDFSRPDLAFSDASGAAFTFRDARKAFFPSWSFIYIYGCNGGFDELFLKSVARTFGVMVFGFGAEMMYLPGYGRNRISSRLNCQYPARLGEVTVGLHRLKPDRFAEPVG